MILMIQKGEVGSLTVLDVKTLISTLVVGSSEIALSSMPPVKYEV